MGYVEDLGSISLNIAAIKDTIKNNILNFISLYEQGIKTEAPLPFHIIGQAGVGKTQICYQIANELTKELGKTFHFTRIVAPTLFRDDFIVPFPKMEVDSDGHRRFEMLYSDIMPAADQECGIFMIDEFSRADHQLQQMLWQIMNEGKLHTYTFPKMWFIIIADNPDESDYSMNVLTDAAGMRRSAKYGVVVDTKTWLNFAINNNFHPSVVGYISAHPEALYDTKAMKLQKLYGNPATWERVSDVMKGFEARNIDINSDVVMMTITGLINTTAAAQFKEFLADRFVSAEEVILINDDKVKNKLKRLMKTNDQMALSSTMSLCLSYFERNCDKKLDEKDIEFKNFSNFIYHVSPDIATLILAKAQEAAHNNNSKFLTFIHSLIILFMKNEDFRNNVHAPMVKANKYSDVFNNLN